MKARVNRYIQAFTLTTVIVVAIGCNKNSNSWFNRNYQNMVARYNVYYNGTEKLNEVLLTLASNHQDNYGGVLDVFPYGDEQQAKAQVAAVDEIIKKGSKIIINRPVSKWVDDAYLLVGKGYFFKADYYAAIETFQYINTRYKNTIIAQEATIWILKSYLMLKRYDDAEALVALLRNEKNFPAQLIGLYGATAAQVYIKQGKYSAALGNIKVALSKARKRSARARYSYIAAQLFERTGYPDSAKVYLQKVIKLNPPYEMAFNAKISLARNYDPNNSAQVRAARRYLKGMLREDKNSSYFDQIYYQLGLIEMREGKTDLAIENFERSLQSTQNNQNQKALTYLVLADLYFKQPDYVLSQKYYDSTVGVIKPEFEDYNSIVKKQAVLSELIKYKVIVNREDSLQALALLSPNELTKRVDKWIKNEERQKKQQEEEEKNKQNQPNNAGGGFPGGAGPGGFGNPGGGNFGTPPGGNSGGVNANNWYFYSQQQLTIGYNDFIKKWGKRKLTDDWRWSTKEKTAPSSDNLGNNDPQTVNQDSATAQAEDPELEKRLAEIPEERRKYYRDIPFSDEDKKLSNERIAGALYNIGIIYFEKLGDVSESINAFTTLINRFKGSEYQSRAYYYLFKIYKDTEPATALIYKKKLIEEYPNSDYALLVNDNPITKQGNLGIEPRKLDFYNTTLGLFNKGRYTEVKSRRITADTMFSGTSLLPKYMLLYAISVGKTDSIETYKNVLTSIIEQYPATDVSFRAKELFDAANRVSKKDSSNVRDTREDAYTYMAENKHYVILVFDTDKGDVNAIQIKISDYNISSFPDQVLDIVPSQLNASQQLLVIRSFENKDKAQDYKKQLESFHALLLGTMNRNDVYYGIISPANYGELTKQKDIAPYKSFFNRYYQ